MSMDEATRAQFELLRQRFLAGLARRMAELDAADDDSSRRAVLHRLAGAAGAYGCEALGQLARQAEQALREPPLGDAAQAREALARLRLDAREIGG